MCFMPVTDPRTVKNRVHLDLTSSTADRDQEIDRLLALGARRVNIGQTVVAVPLVIVTRRICGKAAVQGVSHAALAGLAAGVAGAAVGVTLSLAIPERHKLEAFALAIPAAGGAIIAFAIVAYLLDHGDLRAVLAWVRRVARPRP